MKLKNKFIPILSLLTASSVAAPLSSSCSVLNKEETSSMIDVLRGYEPGTKRAVLAEGLSVDEITDNYVAAIKENPDILRQDLAWFEARAIPYRMTNVAGWFGDELKSNPYYLNSVSNSLGIPKTAKFGLSDISINQVTVVNPTSHDEEKVYTVSLNIDYEYAYEVIATAYDQQGQDIEAVRSYSNKFSGKYTNVPFMLTRGTTSYSTVARRQHTEYGDVGTTTYTGLWNFTMIGWQDQYRWILDALPKWSFEYDVSEVTVDKLTDLTGNTKTYTYNNDFEASIKDTSTLQAFLKDLYDEYGDSQYYFEQELANYCLNFGSYYLYDVLAPKWTLDKVGYYNTITTGFDDATWETLVNNAWEDTTYGTCLPFVILGIQYNITSHQYETKMYPKGNDFTNPHKLLLSGSNLSVKPDTHEKTKGKKYLAMDLLNKDATQKSLIQVEIPAETSIYVNNSSDYYESNIYIPAYFVMKDGLTEEEQTQAKEIIEDIYYDMYNMFAPVNEKAYYFTLPATEEEKIEYNIQFVPVGATEEVPTYTENLTFSEAKKFVWAYYNDVI